MRLEAHTARTLGWQSSPARTLVLATGWTVLIVGSFVGLITGGALAWPVAALAAGFAWVISAIAPDPVPAPRRDVRRRLARLAPIDGHQLPA